jgi:hypothetical protein
MLYKHTVNAPTGRTPLTISPLTVTAQTIIEQTVSAITIIACTVIAMMISVIMLCAATTPLVNQLPLPRGMLPAPGRVHIPHRIFTIIHGVEALPHT